MRRRITLALVALVVCILATVLAFGACSGSSPPEVDSGTDAGVDTGLPDTGGPIDAGQDSTTDARDGGDAGDADADVADAGPVWAVEPTLDVVSTEPCADWAVMADTRPRGLPSDATPRQLWRWRTYDDPVYLALGLFNQYLAGGPSIGPDGHLYIIGPERDRVMSLTRDGHARWISPAMGGDLLPTVAIAPDGDAYVAQAFGGGEFILLRFSPSGDVVGRYPLARRPAGATPSMETVNSIAMGPGGMVYATTAQGRLVATCRGSVRWVMTLRFVVSGHPSYGLHALVDTHGVIWLSGAASQVFRVSAGGAVLETISGESPHHYLGTAYLGGGQTLLGAGSADGSLFWGYLWRDGRFVRQFDDEIHYTKYLLDPVGGIWQITRRPPTAGTYTMSRWVDGVEQWTSERNVIQPFGFPGAWAGDASRIEVRRGGGIRRALPTGEDAWGHEFDRATGVNAGFFSINLDVDGVAYVESGGDIVAFQTDVLPPAESGCWDLGCNRRRNSWEGSP